MKHVDFYFDYLSPFAYLASCEVPKVCERQGATLRFRPILFAGLLNHWGQLGPAEIPPKALHAFRACLRYAKRRGTPFRSPTFHPFNPLTALRATLAAESDADRVRAVRALYTLGWGSGGDLGDEVQIVAALNGAGLDGDALAGEARTDRIKRALKEETERAIGRGVFGIPTMIVDDEIFWGLDQIEDLESVLEGKDSLSGVDLAALAPQGSAAWRRK